MILNARRNLRRAKSKLDCWDDSYKDFCKRPYLKNFIYIEVMRTTPHKTNFPNTEVLLILMRTLACFFSFYIFKF